MKVLFASNYYSSSGYGRAAREYLLALDKVCDVVPRPLFLGGPQVELPERIRDLEAKPSAGCDVNIQLTLPHLMRFNGNYKQNIGMFFYETSSFRPSGWQLRLNEMDKIFVPTAFGRRQAEDSGVTQSVYVVNPATDLSQYDEVYEEPKEVSAHVETNAFKFYTIAELNNRKNLTALIMAFHMEFKEEDNVELIIKTNNERLGTVIQNIKRSLRLYHNLNDYKQEKIIVDHLNEIQIRQLHSYCDCFVTTSNGEGWSYPAMDSLGFGRTPITPASSGFLEYMSNDIGYLADIRQQSVNAGDGLPMLYTAYEDWWPPDLESVKTNMRLAYKERNSSKRYSKIHAGKIKLCSYSYEEVAKQFLNSLES